MPAICMVPAAKLHESTFETQLNHTFYSFLKLSYDRILTRIKLCTNNL